jgi:hypothetical protein
MSFLDPPPSAQDRLLAIRSTNGTHSPHYLLYPRQYTNTCQFPSLKSQHSTQTLRTIHHCLGGLLFSIALFIFINIHSPAHLRSNHHSLLNTAFSPSDSCSLTRQPPRQPQPGR